MQFARWLDDLALESAGSISPAKMPMIAITASSSISVNPGRLRLHLLTPDLTIPQPSSHACRSE
jgi:hypothetical protein